VFIAPLLQCAVDAFGKGRRMELEKMSDAEEQQIAAKIAQALEDKNLFVFKDIISAESKLDPSDILFQICTKENINVS